MQKIYLLMSLGLFLSLSTGCLKDNCDATIRYVTMEPVYQTASQFRNNKVQAIPAQPLVNPGKIYFYKNYVLINEIREGIHFYDNSNPENPIQVAYLPIPGNVDMAIKDDVLLADSYVDLLSINIGNVNQPEFISRTEDVFKLYGQGPDGAYLVNYEPREIKEFTTCDNAGAGQPWLRENNQLFIDVALFDATAGFSSSTDKVLNAAGIGGSMARFTLAENRLYSVDHAQLYTFDVTDPGQPVQTSSQAIGWDIETIFPYDQYLFVGSQSGMHIFSRSDADNPTYVSSYQHMTACDPVFVEGNTAYVTLRDGTTCDNFTNELDVIDISNIYAPYLVATYPMDNPHGLSLANDHLYICEGDGGVKVFDASDRNKIGDRLQAHAKGFNAYDIITLSGENAMIIGKDGFYQYDISDPKKFRQLSVIPVQAQ
ncbi:MAG TPA: hypothetical protein P5275_15235 [Saprospiraceae bacterium]|nr:hypothetical protein [Lewinellaceae bacterium]HRV86226.1 hypothetical protein [Saprospiraceae bacterium]